MTAQVNIPSVTSRGVIATLRAPCAKNSLLKRGYSQNPRHLGQVHVFPATTEPVIAPGSGVVKSIRSLNNTDWGHEAGDLDTFKTFQVAIDHGGYVSTIIQGLSSVSVVIGQYVTRGVVLGMPRTTEIFFQLVLNSSPLDPASYSNFFRGFDSGKVTGKGQRLRGGPDFIDRADSGTVSYSSGGVRYFVDELCNKPALLVNIDFNGSLKTGLAATGFFNTDYWNSYNPVSFGSLPGDTCSNLLNPNPVKTASYSDTMPVTWSWSSGSAALAIFEVSGTEAATSTLAWLDGSTDTIPEIDAQPVTWSWVSGTVIDTGVPTSQSDSGTTSSSWSSGTLMDIVIYGLGTNYPTVTPYDEYVGTTVVSWVSGTAYDLVETVTVSDDVGTTVVSWMNGTADTIIVTSSIDEAGTSTWAWLSGQIT